MTLRTELLGAAIYLLLGRGLVALRSRARFAGFALLNLAAVYFFFFWGKDEFARLAVFINIAFAAYFIVVSAQYLLMRWWGEREGWRSLLAFLMPIAFLVFVRYTPVVEIARFVNVSIYNVLRRHPELGLNWLFIGISYLAFRTSYLVIEVRNRTVSRPGYWEYIGFAFFAPTMFVGPISPFALHHRAFAESDAPAIPIGRAMLRVLVGAVKFRFFGPMLNQLTYSGLLLDGHPHHWIDLPIAVIVYYLYLYCNFSGFCDIAIGAAGVMGVPVAENFDNPFAARNVRDFWNRWHITLSQWMRDVVFSPLSKILVRWFGPANANHAIAVTIFVVFLLVGVWHGVGWNYAAFGVMHGVGVVANHYYTIALKKRLGRDRFAAYNRSPMIHAIAVALTFLYVAASLFVFANNWRDMKSIFSMLRA